MLPQTSLAHILEKKEKLDMARSGRLVCDKYRVDTWAWVDSHCETGSLRIYSRSLSGHLLYGPIIL